VKIIKQTTMSLELPQQVFLGDFWNDYGLPQRAMLAQPVFREGAWVLRLAMLDAAAAGAINDTLEKFTGRDENLPDPTQP
jgi:hypothetical protein